jgi:hypothetical protein
MSKYWGIADYRIGAGENQKIIYRLLDTVDVYAAKKGEK